jgi:hypothetical protein
MAALLSLAGALCSAGCVFFTASVRDCGLRSERLQCSSAARGPFSRGYTDARRSRFSLCYTTDRRERWLNFRGNELLSLARSKGGEQKNSRKDITRGRIGEVEGLVLSERATRGYVSSRSKWRDLDVPLEFQAVTAKSGPGEASAISVQFPLLETGLGKEEKLSDERARASSSVRIWLLLDQTDGNDARWIAMNISRSEYRTTSGKTAQALLPVAVAADLVTWPLQLLIISQLTH